MDLDDAVAWLALIARADNHWLDSDWRPGTDGETTKLAIRIVLSELSFYHTYADTIPSLRAYTLRDKD